MKKRIGQFMIVALFLGMFIFFGINDGWILALKTYLITLAIVVFVTVAAVLISSE